MLEAPVIQFNLPVMLQQEFKDTKLKAATPKEVRPNDLWVALGKLHHIQGFGTIGEDNGDIQNFEQESPFQPKTEATSDLKPSEEFRPQSDPIVPSKPPKMLPSFQCGVFAYHGYKKAPMLSGHQKLRRLPLSHDLMAEILIELARHPGKYSFQTLPRILKSQFGVPRPVHWRAWTAFKKKYDLIEQQVPPMPRRYHQIIRQIVAIEPKPMLVP